MRDELCQLMCCPETSASLYLHRVHRYFEINGYRHVVQGLLRAKGHETLAYPVIDEIPRILPRRQLTDSERSALDELIAHSNSSLPVEPVRVEPELPTEAEIRTALRARVEAAYGIHEQSPVSSRRRCLSAVEYNLGEYSGSNKAKYVTLLAPRISNVDSLLEVGGNFPGLTRQLGMHYSPKRSVVANLEIPYPSAFKTESRDIDLVRADGQALPFKRESFDLAVSAFTLEHIPDWRRALESMMRVSSSVFLAFGPNKHFPWEIGHLDAPLAGTLPKPLAAWTTWLWLAAIGRHRPIRRIRAILDQVFHVSSRAFEREARRLGGCPVNLFPDLVETLLAEAGDTRAKRLLRSQPRLSRRIASLLARLHVEPQIYYLISS
jgi:uncharacterized protein YbaR (Trm112 family)